MITFDDAMLFRALFDKDPAVCEAARRLLMKSEEYQAISTEPAHCSECFEGCPNCQGESHDPA